MGIVSNAGPTTLSAVKTALGSGETYQELTDFYNTGAAGLANVGGANGMLPTSGTIKLTDLKDATKANLRGNIYISSKGLDDAGTITADNSVTFYANGTLVLHGGSTGSAGEGTTGNITADDFSSITTSFDREWLYQNTNACLTDTANNWEIKLTKTAGTFAAPASNATFIPFPHSVSCDSSRSGEGTDTDNITCNVQIRRVDTGVVVENGSIRLETTAHVFNPCPTCCFTPETLITMHDMSTKAIAFVQIGDSILVRGGGTKKITEVITRENRVMYQFRFADGRILNASEDHPLYVKGKGYASMTPTVVYKDLGVPQKIVVGDFVLDQSGAGNKIESINDLYYPHTVYTFAESEFYANGMLVY